MFNNKGPVLDTKGTVFYTKGPVFDNRGAVFDKIGPVLDSNGARILTVRISELIKYTSGIREFWRW